ncbi:hypothetical protein HOK68_02765 [Candidatus Woesearchaeota archaeon]|jgi:hypothetical protein|nr:hypothetical protein [Candidatus Woesearchaeota archaeon]MBT4387119.1 hypothetical protein [Candidatus Woesearchaeota archaeon]MBT4596124.1 hypothetical protein [Candidatus Woesearchaeota archaeon]MBT5741653.1 hypothetical protein [Candidatus Woesearchaeota archaeon]MBT6505674.1 hypothetical protein [Candidatus Woesearchaeota archaeon]
MFKKLLLMLFTFIPFVSATEGDFTTFISEFLTGFNTSFTQFLSTDGFIIFILIIVFTIFLYKALLLIVSSVNSNFYSSHENTVNKLLTALSVILVLTFMVIGRDNVADVEKAFTNFSFFTISYVLLFLCVLFSYDVYTKLRDFFRDNLTHSAGEYYVLSISMAVITLYVVFKSLLMGVISLIANVSIEDGVITSGGDEFGGLIISYVLNQSFFFYLPLIIIVITLIVVWFGKTSSNLNYNYMDGFSNIPPKQAVGNLKKHENEISSKINELIRDKKSIADEFQEHMMGLSKLHNITLTGSHSSEVSFNNTIDGLTSVIHNLRSSSKKYFDFLNSIEKKLASNLKKTIISEDHLLDSGVDENLKDVCNKIFNKFLNNEIHDYREIANHEHKFISDLNSLVHHLENLEIYCIDPSISEDSITLCDKNKSSLAKLIAPKIKMLKRKIVQLGHMELPRKL